MNQRNLLTILAFFVVALTTLSACQSRYGHMTRRVSFEKKQVPQPHTRWGHYVSAKEQAAPLTQTHKTSLRPAKKTIIPRTPLNLRETPESLISNPTNRFTTADSVKDSEQKDTTGTGDNPRVSTQPDNELAGSAIVMFGLVTAINVAMLATSSFNFMSVALLIGLGLLIAGYFVGKMVKNMGETVIRPPKSARRNSASRDQLKKVVQIFFIVAAILLLVSLLASLAAVFEIAAVFGALGLIALWAGLLGGLTYLLMGI